MLQYMLLANVTTIQKINKPPKSRKNFQLEQTVTSETIKSHSHPSLVKCIIHIQLIIFTKIEASG